jgi:uncharacterized protein (DUF362 family)
MNKRRVVIYKSEGKLEAVVRTALKEVGILDGLNSSTRVAIKPNLTYPHYKPGVTTSPAVIRAAVKVLSDYSPHITIVETDGGYGVWSANEAFEGHGLFGIAKEFGIKVVNLCDGEKEYISFKAGLWQRGLPLPKLLLRETDLFITMPVPKIHAMTLVSLAYKNQWGCIPDIMRLRRHSIFNEAIVEINKVLKPAVLADGTYFLDQHGPMEGVPIKMDYIIAATDAGAFDRYVSEMMGIDWRHVPHLSRAAAQGEMPMGLEEIQYNISPAAAKTHTFRLHRGLRDWIAFVGFKSRFMTWFGYESWFGRVVLHSILYAIAGPNVKPKSYDPGTAKHPPAA